MPGRVERDARRRIEGGSSGIAAIAAVSARAGTRQCGDRTRGAVCSAMVVADSVKNRFPSESIASPNGMSTGAAVAGPPFPKPPPATVVMIEPALVPD